MRLDFYTGTPNDTDPLRFSEALNNVDPVCHPDIPGGTYQIKYTVNNSIAPNCSSNDCTLTVSGNTLVFNTPPLGEYIARNTYSMLSVCCLSLVIFKCFRVFILNDKSYFCVPSIKIQILYLKLDSFLFVV